MDIHLFKITVCSAYMHLYLPVLHGPVETALNRPTAQQEVASPGTPAGPARPGQLVEAWPQLLGQQQALGPPQLGQQNLAGGGGAVWEPPRLPVIKISSSLY